jgi:hypothetical protein
VLKATNGRTAGHLSRAVDDIDDRLGGEAAATCSARAATPLLEAGGAGSLQDRPSRCWPVVRRRRAALAADNRAESNGQERVAAPNGTSTVGTTSTDAAQPYPNATVIIVVPDPLTSSTRCSYGRPRTIVRATSAGQRGKQIDGFRPQVASCPCGCVRSARVSRVATLCSTLRGQRRIRHSVGWTCPARLDFRLVRDVEASVSSGVDHVAK